ncbi:hypothetical protein D1B31_06575 [Neobacillus notoginsengisoli]|uniref:Uncharacterized protein n=1 Tax=Neobacillus notoginsengisoli TaxID=1578198 RepID=A0A417YXR8_9BACI|nr:hypothetical protein [Neobacillus notoginsengisoli]RHW42280.1 hypothetical protein D1B31_06575 [Neobacillus notoginsengisoli]
MFDPTAFDNMKVIIEGTFYDLDADGKIMVMDRKDLMDLASISRQFSLFFYVPEFPGIEAEFRLIAGLENLASELLEKDQAGPKAGCELILYFRAVHDDSPLIYREIQTYMETAWGSERKILQTVYRNPLDGQPAVMNEIVVDFNRLVTESQLEDLKDIPVYMVDAIGGLYSLLAEGRR